MLSYDTSDMHRRPLAFSAFNYQPKSVYDSHDQVVFQSFKYPLSNPINSSSNESMKFSFPHTSTFKQGPDSDQLFHSKSIDGLNQVKIQLSNLKNMQTQQRNKLDSFLKTINSDLSNSYMHKKSYDTKELSQSQILKTSQHLKINRQTSPLKSQGSPQKINQKQFYLNYKTDLLFEEYDRYKKLFADRFKTRLEFIKHICATTPKNKKILQDIQQDQYIFTESGLLSPQYKLMTQTSPHFFKKNDPHSLTPMTISQENHIEPFLTSKSPNDFSDIHITDLENNQSKIDLKSELSQEKPNHSQVQDLFKKFDVLQRQSQENFQNLRYDLQKIDRKNSQQQNGNPKQSSTEKQDDNHIERSSQTEIQTEVQTEFQTQTQTQTEELSASQQFEPLRVKTSMSHLKNYLEGESPLNKKLNTIKQKLSDDTNMLNRLTLTNMWNEQAPMDLQKEQQKEEKQKEKYQQKEERFNHLTELVRKSHSFQKSELIPKEDQIENRQKVREVMRNIRNGEKFRNMLGEAYNHEDFQHFMNNRPIDQPTAGYKDSFAEDTITIRKKSDMTTSTLIFEGSKDKNDQQLKLNIQSLLQKNYDQFNIVPMMNKQRNISQKYQASLFEIQEDNQRNSDLMQNSDDFQTKSSIKSVNDMKVSEELFQNRRKTCNHPPPLNPLYFRNFDSN